MPCARYWSLVAVGFGVSANGRRRYSHDESWVGAVTGWGSWEAWRFQTRGARLICGDCEKKHAFLHQHIQCHSSIIVLFTTLTHLTAKSNHFWSSGARTCFLYAPQPYFFCMYASVRNHQGCSLGAKASGQRQMAVPVYYYKAIHLYTLFSTQT